MSDIKKITLYDSSITTDNLGDGIIMVAVRKHLREVFPYGFFTSIPSHDYPGKVGLAKAKACDYAFIGGTNMIASHWLRYHQLKLRLRDLGSVKPFLLMGVGWHKYQRDPDPVTRAIYGKIFDRTMLHSVRDRYTHDKLKRAGFDNIVYTGCPTMWDLSPTHVAAIPTTKADRVLFTLTAYLRDDKADRAILDLLAKRYSKVYFWPQMYDDMAYLEEIGADYLASGKVEITEPTLEAVNETLASGDMDYVGLRLHCGVLALQNSVRSLIVIVDNRAAEIGRDTSLPVVKREELERINRWIDGSEPVNLTLPLDEIATWKAQFASR